jgi:hypothetical protein
VPHSSRALKRASDQKGQAQTFNQFQRVTLRFEVERLGYFLRVAEPARCKLE